MNRDPRDARIGRIPVSPLHAGPGFKSGSTDLAPFASPDAFDPVLRDFLHQSSELLCRWLGSSDQRTPLPTIRPAPEVNPASHGVSMPQLLDDLQIVMDGAYQPSHPGALAHLDPPPLTASIAADLICAGLNNNLLAEELSPGLSALELELCRWFAQRLGFPDGTTGVLASGGTLSNLMALVAARERVHPEHRQRGVVLCSRDAHVSLLKAVRVMGLHDDALQQLSVDPEGRLCLDALEERLAALHHQGRPCLAVVATAGTTVRGAVDSMDHIAALCQRYGIWLHVDGAIGAVFGLAPSTAELVRGLSSADSLTVNPQKLLGITKASSLLLMRDPTELRRVFSTGLPYMEAPLGEHHGGEVGLQGTRPAEVLKLWLGLRQLGENGIETVLRSALDRCRQFTQRLDPHQFTLHNGSLHLLAFRPSGHSDQQSDRWSETTRRILIQHRFMLSRPLYGSSHCLKAVLGNPHTTSEHLDQLASLINQSVI